MENQIAKKLPNIEHWNELKEYWNHQLRQTTGEFVKGILTIDPIHEKDTCKVCDQKTLCRKTELLSRFSGEEE